MKNLSIRITFGFLLVLSSIITAQAQYKFDGYVRDTEDYTTQTPYPGATVTVYNENDTTASGLTHCTTGAGISNPVTADSNGYFCFRGTAIRYNIVVTFTVSTMSGTTTVSRKYRWISEEVVAPGIYSLKDFGAKGDGTDETFLIKSAMAFIGFRPEIGGQLTVPNGVFKVRGDTIGTYEEAKLPIILPPGLTLQGTNSKTSFASSRIQLDLENKTIFKIGNNTHSITIRDLGIVTPMVAVGGGFAPRPGTKALLAQGAAPNYNLNFIFSNITIQGFYTGIHLDGTDPDKGWQFDFVKLENSRIIECFTGIHFDTLNTDWLITNSIIGTVPNGTGMLIDKIGMLQLINVFGGGPPASAPINRALSGKAFIWIKGQHAGIDIQNSQCENARNAILYDWDNTLFDPYSFPLKVQNSQFGNGIKFRSNAYFVSIGNTYASNSVRTLRPQTTDPEEPNDTYIGSSATQIYSFGDRFLSQNINLENCPPLPSTSQFPAAAAATCKRDFYIDNSGGETNTVVVRTSQRRIHANDNENVDFNLFQSPLKITSPQASGSNTAWGYSIGRSLTDGFLEFTGNQPNFSNYRFNGGVYPSADATYELGNGTKRWSLIRGVTVVSGDTILSDKVTGKELYKIHEDEQNIYFRDIRNGKEMMRIDRDGNLYVAGKIIQGKKAAASRTTLRTTARRRRGSR